VVLDFRDLTRWELIVGAAGIALLIVLFVPDWDGVKAEEFLGETGGTVLEDVEVDARNAFGAFTWLDLGLLVAAVAAIALPLLSAVRPPLGLGRWPALAVTALALASVVLVAFRLIDPPDLARTIAGARIRVSDVDGAEVIRKIGAWPGLAASLLIALAAVVQARRPD
jgi:hypothetical protein